MDVGFVVAALGDESNGGAEARGEQLGGVVAAEFFDERAGVGVAQLGDFGVIDARPAIDELRAIR